MILYEIINQEGKRSTLPHELAALLAQHFGTEAEFLFSAIHSAGHWSVYLQLPSGKQELVHGTFSTDGWQLSAAAHVPQGCLYDLPDCRGELWHCSSCGRQFCQEHAGVDSDLCDACKYDKTMEGAVDSALRG